MFGPNPREFSKSFFSAPTKAFSRENEKHTFSEFFVIENLKYSTLTMLLIITRTKANFSVEYMIVLDVVSGGKQ